ncbi:MAG: bifunctional phosphopantothenoylcysteine decarboxylase/phosphopantothenate--cysteine ligase CoaBC [Sphingomonadaceae bacterium]|nr:bifunctional phosphopantothenoylcysteine decarboxylase/phosphopantothenate--cysteine ligase CoaBC [Sphingomonadaceae bacterium]
MQRKSILLLISGGIAAYKSAELIRLLRKAGVGVTCVLTKGGAQFVTPLTLGALSENKVYTDLFDLKDEVEMGHIQLSRATDMIIVCPASADILAKMAAGIADDLATTILLATDKPVIVAPAMNVRMWQHAATRRNVAQLRADGVTIIEPDVGEMACGEFGPGRLPEPAALLTHVLAALAGDSADALAGQPDFADDNVDALDGRHILITAGPTHEAIDPVRYIANKSSGKQGFAIAAAAADAGANVTLVAGPVNLPTPPGVTRIDVTSAREMAATVEKALPADVAIMVAAVADWRAAAIAPTKIKKDGSGIIPPLPLTQNPDILAGLASSPQRPGLLIGFAAETDNVIAHAQAKLARKGCDWIIANDVAADPMGGEVNRVHIITANGVESWDRLSKSAVARAIIAKIAEILPGME